MRLETEKVWPSPPADVSSVKKAACSPEDAETRRRPLLLHNPQSSGEDDATRDELSKAENFEADYVGDDDNSSTSPADDDGGWAVAAPSSSGVAAPPSSLVLPGGGQKHT